MNLEWRFVNNGCWAARGMSTTFWLGQLPNGRRAEPADPWTLFYGRDVRRGEYADIEDAKREAERLNEADAEFTDRMKAAGITRS
jgi:hypothetical protein